MKLLELFSAVSATTLWSTPDALAADCANVVASDLMSDVLMTDEGSP